MMDTKTGEIINFVIYSMSEPDLTCNFFHVRT